WPWCRAACCEPTPSRTPPVWPPHRTSRRWTRRDFRNCTFRVWGGLFVPKGTPKSVIAKLNSATTIALADPAVRRQLANIGQEVVPREQQTPEALAAVQRADIEKWWPIIKAANIKAE